MLAYLIWSQPRTVVRALLCPRLASVSRPYSSARSVDDGLTPLTSVLIANRGEIALRVGRTASAWAIRTTTIYTEPDSKSQHALSSPSAVDIGEPSAYLDGDRIIEIAMREGCQSIHPGYGFLSENSTFARKCTEAGLSFIGPPWRAIEAMGNKSESKNIMEAAGVRCIPGYHGVNQEPEALRAEATKIGYPVLLKAVKGGGGKGMRIVDRDAEFFEQLTAAKSEARNAFGDDQMLVEKYITTPRHIEVQIFADKHGSCVALGERDCSVQRRHQKILEESPAPNLGPELRRELWDKARAAALAVRYEGAGTVEFIFDNDAQTFYFMEMNTRLQVEHAVTEMVTGQDLVHWQFLVAAGGKLPLTQEEVEARIAERGWAFEARIYAENPDMNFMPDSGQLIHLKTPDRSEDVRIDAGFVQGDKITSHYDPMIAKLIVRGPTRRAALQRMRAALAGYEIVGPKTNIEFLKRVCNSDDFIAGEVETGFIDKHRDELFPATTVSDEVLAQAAISVILEDMVARQTSQSLFGSVKPSRTLPSGAVVGLGTGLAPEREMSFVTSPTPTRDFIGTTSIESDDGSDAREKKATAVIVRQKSSDTFDVAINGEARFFSVKSRLDRPSETLTSFFPGHTRLDSRIIRVDSNVGNLVGGEGGWPHDGIPCPSTTMHIFQRGQHHVLDLAGPSWITKALAHPSHSFFSRAEDAPRPSHAPKRHQDGTSTGTPQCTSDAAVTPGRDAEVANKRRTTAKIIPCPMPCKILRVHVAAGEQVERGQALLVIESMKMETVVRSPQTGTVQRVWAVGGDLCKAGAPMVEIDCSSST